VQWDIGGFYGKLTTNVFAMPAVLFGFCVLLYFNQRRTIGAVIAAGGSDESAYRTATVGFKQNIFFAIFLLCEYENARKVTQAAMQGVYKHFRGSPHHRCVHTST
jgi:hypothetical protein